LYVVDIGSKRHAFAARNSVGDASESVLEFVANEPHTHAGTMLVESEYGDASHTLGLKIRGDNLERRKAGKPTVAQLTYGALGGVSNALVNSSCSCIQNRKTRSRRWSQSELSGVGAGRLGRVSDDLKRRILHKLPFWPWTSIVRTYS